MNYWKNDYTYEELRGVQEILTREEIMSGAKVEINTLFYTLVPKTITIEEFELFTTKVYSELAELWDRVEKRDPLKNL